MNFFFKSIVYSTISCFIFSSSFSQDRILTKKGDTLSVFVKNIEALKVFYVKKNTQASETFEISKSSLHKIIWRTGKEYIIDLEYENLALLSTLKNQNLGTSSSQKASKDVLSKDVLATKQNILFPEIKIDTLPPAPILNRGYMFFYYVYKVNGQRVKAKKMEEVMWKYEKQSHFLFSDGLYGVKTHRRNFWIGTAARLASIPLVYVSPELQSGVSFGLSIYNFVQELKVWKSRKAMKNAIQLYNNKRRSNSLKPANAVIRPR